MSGYLQEDHYLTIGDTAENTLVTLGYLFLCSYGDTLLALVHASRRPMLFLFAYIHGDLLHTGGNMYPNEKTTPKLSCAYKTLL